MLLVRECDLDRRLSPSAAPLRFFLREYLLFLPLSLRLITYRRVSVVSGVGGPNLELFSLARPGPLDPLCFGILFFPFWIEKDGFFP